MINTLLALLTAFTATALMGPWFIPMLRKLKFGQSILDIGPSWHKAKQGTPTMGGILFIIGINIAVLIFAAKQLFSLDYKLIAVIIASLIFGIIGFVDDFIKIKLKRNLGLTVFQKLILQILTASGFVLFLAARQELFTEINIPAFNISWDIGWIYYGFAVIAIVGFVNSVNLTDGIDGLAATVTVPYMTLILILSLRLNAVGMSVFSIAVIGGCFGFLIYNINPAKVFMGDTGSLYLGAVVVLSAFALNLPLLPFVAGLIYAIEALSVILQVIYFKLTGKRLFKMSPLHHHFELKGWKENKIVIVFTTFTLIMCVLAFLLFA